MAEPDGMTTVTSRFDALETAHRLKTALDARGLTLFAEIDHAAGAVAAGLELRPTLVLVFGNAKGGTPLMQADQRVGIDLPLKALIWEDPDTKTWIAYNDPLYVVRRHAVATELSANLAAVVPLLQRAAQA